MVANTPSPSGPGLSPNVNAPKVISPASLSISGPVGTTVLPVFPKKSPSWTSVACTILTMLPSYLSVNSKAPKFATSSIETFTVSVPGRGICWEAGSIFTVVAKADKNVCPTKVASINNKVKVMVKMNKVNRFMCSSFGNWEK